MAESRESPARGVGVARVVCRTLACLLSVLVFGGTFLGWAQVNQLISGLPTANVIDPGAVVGPAAEQNILLVGLDARTDAQGNPLPQSILDQLNAGGSPARGDRTDTMIVVHIPAGGADAVAFSIPRDSYVQLAGGYGMHKINSAYGYAQVFAMDRLRAQGVGGARRNVEAAQAGAKNAIQTVEQLTGLTINHFAAVNLVGFYDISKAVGGVAVCLVAPVDDPLSGARFAAGPQTISGAQALAFVRQRHGLPGGDLDRIRRQQAFLASLARTVLSAGTLADPEKLNKLIAAVTKNVTIDQGWDVFSFARHLQNMSAGKIEFHTIPVVDTGYQTPDGSAVEVDPAAVRAYIAETISPVPPAPSAARPSGQTAAPTASPQPVQPPPIDAASGVPCVR